MAATTSSAHVHYGATAEEAPALAGEATPRGRRSALLVSVALVACAAAASARHAGRARTRLAASSDDGRGHKVHNNQIDDDKTYVVDDNIYDNGTIPSGCAWRDFKCADGVLQNAEVFCKHECESGVASFNFCGVYTTGSCGQYQGIGGYTCMCCEEACSAVDYDDAYDTFFKKHDETKNEKLLGKEEEEEKEKSNPLARPDPKQEGEKN